MDAEGNVDVKDIFTFVVPPINVAWHVPDRYSGIHFQPRSSTESQWHVSRNVIGPDDQNTFMIRATLTYLY